jgi:calcium-translocating P-type ATPase
MTRADAEARNGRPAPTITDPVESTVDPNEPIDRLLRDLRGSRDGLSSLEAQRRLIVYGTNELVTRGGRQWPRALVRQFTHPLALLLWAAAALAGLAGIEEVAFAIIAVIVLNAVFAFVQELQAGRAVEALQRYLPAHATALRDRQPQPVLASELVPGDVLVIEEGDRISADARLISGSVEVDTSTLTGESMPVVRSAELSDLTVPVQQAPDLVFSGTTCIGGDARALVFATGMHTELGRIAALSERVDAEESPLEHQVRRVAWLIAAIAVAMAIAFLPIATVGGGLSFSNAIVLVVGLIVGNVPEGLLPVITLSLAIGVRGLARRGAIVKRLSAVETLGSTDVICTDKTGTLTENRMLPISIWTAAGEFDAQAPDSLASTDGPVATLVDVMTACNNASIAVEPPSGDPTEIGLLQAAERLGRGRPPSAVTRITQFHFDPALKLMTTVDQRGDAVWIDTKGAPEALLPCCTTITTEEGTLRTLDDSERTMLAARIDGYASRGLRVLGFAARQLEPNAMPPATRADAEHCLSFLGLVAMLDPPRPEVAEAVAECHTAGIRIIVITGDHPLTAISIAHDVGIARDPSTVVTGAQLDEMHDLELDELLRKGEEVVFARSSPEAKLRITDALRAQSHVVAMTGDGVNDAPALQRADIGIAMGASGTDVAREAATMILTNDNFATIAAAVEAGRVVYDNIRKFIFYIFTHLTPEIAAFLIFALSRGSVPLPLSVLLLLTFDVVTETLPALALGREPAEPGIMSRPPHPHEQNIVQRSMLVRAWVFLGLIAAALVMGGFFYVLGNAGWHPGDPVGAGHPLHHAYQQAVTMTFLGMVMCQVGTAFAARTDLASLRSVGVFSNRLLLWGIAFELGVTAMIIYLPLFQDLLGTAPPPLDAVLITASFPVIVWGADEIRRLLLRRRIATEAVAVAA